MTIARLVVLLAAAATGLAGLSSAVPVAAQGAPAVTGVAVTSEAGADATYARGETVRVTVAFSEAVAVTGTPTLAIDMDPAHWGTKRAAYESGGGTAALVFAHRVVEPNLSTQGIAVLADTLALNGGTIRSVSSQADAALAHEGLAHDASHKVDWRLADTVPPRLVRGEVDGGTMRLFFSEALDPNATGGRFFVDLARNPVTAGFSPAGPVSVSGNVVTVGFGAGNPQAKAGLPGGDFVLYARRADGGGGALRDLAGNPVQAPHVLPYADGAAWRGAEEWRFVNIRLANLTGPAVTGVALVSDAGPDGTYAHGETLRAAVTFSEAVAVTGTPRLKLDLGAGVAKWAEYAAGSGTAALAFAWKVAPGAMSASGVAVPANALALNGGTIRAAARDRDAELAHEGLAADASHKVDGTPDTRAPRLSRTAVRGEKLTLAFNEAIDDAASLSKGAFTVKKTPPGGAEQTVGLSGTPAIEGEAVTLTLVEAVRKADRNVKVSYLRSALDVGNRLRDAAGNEVSGFSDEPVANAAADTTPPTLSAAAVDGATLTLTFSEPLDTTSVPTGRAFRMQVLPLGRFMRGADSAVTINGNKVTVTLPEPVPPDLDVETRYYKPDEGDKLRDLFGNEAETTTVIRAANLTPPTLSGASVNGTTLRLTFNEVLGAAASLANGAFTVKKTPQGGSEQTVSLNGSPAIDGATVTLTLASAVLATDTGVKVGYARPTSGTGNRLRDAAGNEVVSFTNQPVVKGIDVTPPRLVRGEVDGGRVTLYFSEALDPDSVGGYFRVKIRPSRYSTALFTASRGMNVNGHMVTVWLGPNDPRAQPGLLDGHYAAYFKDTGPTAKALRDLAGNEVKYTPFITLVNVTGVAPAVTGVALVSDAGAGATYLLGDTIRIRLTFSEAVNVTGTPRLKLDFSSGTGDEKWAGYASGSGTKTLEFAYTVAQDDVSRAGVAVLASTLELNGGAIRSAATEADARLLHAGLDHDPNHKVAGVPLPLSVALSSDAGADRTYALGETIRVRLTFSEAVNVTGTPRLKLDFSSGTGDEKWAGYASGSGTKMLEFAYTMAQDDVSSAGVAVLADTLELNGGTIRSAATQADAHRAHAGLAHDPNHRVDTAPPMLSVASMNGAALKLTFDESLGAAASPANGAFTVKKTPQGAPEETVSLTGLPAIDGATVTLTLESAVLATDTGVKVSYARPTSGTGNRIVDAAGNQAASFTDLAVVPDGTPPRLVRGEIDSGTMTLYFSEALDPDSVGGQFVVFVFLAVNRPHGFYATGDVEIDGNKVTVGLGKGNPQAQPGLFANTYYEDPAAKGLRDLDRHALCGLRVRRGRRARLAPRLAARVGPAAILLPRPRNDPPRARQPRTGLRGRQAGARRHAEERGPLVSAGLEERSRAVGPNSTRKPASLLPGSKSAPRADGRARPVPPAPAP